LSNFERGQIIGFAGISVIKTATLLGLLRATVSKVMSASNHGNTTSAKWNSRRKSAFTDRDCSTLRTIVSKNHTTTAEQVTAELNIHLEDTVSTKIVRRELHKSNIHDSGRAAIAKPLITENNAQMHKR
jgi:hypothetical protein